MTTPTGTARITIHQLMARERELLGGLFAAAGGVADERFTIAALACAAARGIPAHTAIALTDAGLVVDLLIPDPS